MTGRRAYIKHEKQVTKKTSYRVLQDAITKNSK